MSDTLIAECDEPVVLRAAATTVATCTVSYEASPPSATYLFYADDTAMRYADNTQLEYA